MVSEVRPDPDSSHKFSLMAIFGQGSTKCKGVVNATYLALDKLQAATFREAKPHLTLAHGWHNNTNPDEIGLDSLALGAITQLELYGLFGGSGRGSGIKIS